MKQIRLCSIENCEREFYGVEWCRLHWRRWKKHGDPFNAQIKHQMTGTKVYNTWRAIKRRCYTPGATGYKNYGGRGIKVCDRWINSFQNFYQDMGEPPTSEHSIERVDHNGNYEPNNCKWADKYEQAQNKRLLRNNKTGYHNVYKTKDTYYAQIRRNNVSHYIGSFKTAEEAHIAHELYITSLSDRSS